MTAGSGEFKLSYGSLRVSFLRRNAVRGRLTFGVNAFSETQLKLNTHRRRRRHSTVELSRVGGVNAPVGSRDPVYNFLCC